MLLRRHRMSHYTARTYTYLVLEPLRRKHCSYGRTMIASRLLVSRFLHRYTVTKVTRAA